MTNGWMGAATLEDLEAAYDSLPDKRSVYAQALAEVIAQRRAQLAPDREEPGTEAASD